MSKCTTINPDILIWARETAGYKLEHLFPKFKKLADWESGVDYPTYIQLQALSEKYKRPIAIFFFPDPPDEKPINKSFRTIPDYEFGNLSPKLIQLFKKAQVMQLNLKELNDNKNPASKSIVKDLKISNNFSVNDLSAIRNFLEVDLVEQKKWKDIKDAFENWRDAFAHCGIFVFKEAFKDDNVSGFCLYDDEFPVIFVNNSVSKTRQIFTLFHELAHILIKISHIDLENSEYIDSLDKLNKNIEINCNKFAGDFLVPIEDFLKNAINKNIDENLIVNLANNYSVSREVILRKFFNQKLVSQQYYEKKSQEWAKQAKEYSKKGNGGDYYYTQISYLGNPYLGLVFDKYYSKRIPFEKAVECIGLKATSFNKLESYFLKPRSV